MRGRWWAVGLILVIAAAAAVTSGGGGDRDADPADAVGVVIGIDEVEVAGDVLLVAAWVASDGSEPPVVEVRTPRRFDLVVADQRRVDRDIADPTRRHWGLRAEVPARGATEVCVVFAGDIACRALGCSDSLFGPEFMASLDQVIGDRRATAQVVDTRTGCVYDIEPGLLITTASVMKLEVLGDLLLDAQRAERELTASERARAEDMMQWSSNPATGSLYGHIGGVPSLEAHSASVGADNTRHTPVFGATWSTAADRNAVVLAVLAGIGELRGFGIDTAWEIMGGVVDAQSWGVSAGVPDGWASVHKNGFYPFGQHAWRVGTTGFVADPDGGGYALTVMTDGNADQAAGVALVELVAGHVAEHLTWGAAAARAYDDVECLTHFGSATWQSLARELGLSASDAEAVRIAAGGDGPLQGQSICTP